MRNVRPRQSAALFAALALLLTTSEQADAGLLKHAGKSLGAGVLESAIKPGISQLEGSGHNLLADLEGRVDRQISNVGGTLNASLDRADQLLDSRVQQVDAVAESRLDQADSILAARIAQIDTSLDQRLTNAIGDLNADARQRIAQLGGEGRSLVRSLNEAGKQQLERADGILRARVTQIGEVVERAIADVDQALATQIDELDEIVGRRLGNVDTIATKQGMNLEQSLIRLAVLVALLAFAVFLLRRLYDDVTRLWDEQKDLSRLKRTGNAALTALHGGAIRLLAGAACAGALWVAYRYLPLGVSRRAAALVQLHERALATSEQHFDLTGLKHHASQLALLDPERGDAFRARTLKWELVRDVLARPGLFEQPAAAQKLLVSIAGVEAALVSTGVVTAQGDADLTALRGYIRWQTAESRDDEHVAASLCAQALGLSTSFLLRPLALNYVRSFVYDPLPGLQVDADRLALDPLRRSAVSEAPGSFAPLQHVIDYDNLVMQLDFEAGNAYIAMVESHARYVSALAALAPREREPASSAARDGLSAAQLAVLEAKQARLAQANAVVDAWRRFDEQLAARPEIESSTAPLALFLLNDVQLAHALWWQAKGDDARASSDCRSGAAQRHCGPPALALEPDPLVRSAATPLRVSWARRYVNPLGQRLQRLLVFEASEQFAQREAQTLAFEDALVRLRLAERGRGAAAEPAPVALRATAALRAAELGLYEGPRDTRAAYGLALLGPSPAGAARDAVLAAYRERQLRLL